MDFSRASTYALSRGRRRRVLSSAARLRPLALARFHEGSERAGRCATSLGFAVPPNLVLTYFTCLLVAPILVLEGCAHQRMVVTNRPAPLAEQIRADLGTIIGVLPGRVTSRSHYERYETTVWSASGEHASGGAIAGAAVGSTGALALLPFAIVFPPMLVVAGGVLLISTAGGAAAGVSQQAPAPDHGQSLVEAERAMGDALGLQRAQADFHRRLMKAGRELPAPDFVSLEEGEPSARGEALDLQVFAEAGFETLLLANVDEIAVRAGEGANPVLAVDVVVRSTLLSAGRDGPIDERTFTCRAGKRPARAWRVHGDRSLRDAVSRCYDKIADRIVEELFLVSLPSDGSVARFGGSGFARVDQEADRVRLTWGAFRAAGSRVTPPPDEASRPRDVRYDLRVWRAEDGFPGDLVYERNGLPEASHTVERPLDPSTSYFWTVRARFQLGGGTRVTPWAVTQERHGYSPERLDRVTNDFYYRFTTPPPPGA